MSAAWETTTEDVATVLDAHGIEYSAEQLNEWHCDLDHDFIEDSLLNYCSMNAQTNSMLMDIEDQLMEEGVIPKGEKKFVMQEGDETEVDDWNEDDGEEEDELDEEQE